jgi:transposase
MSPDSSRDQRRDVKLMYRLGFTQARISSELQLSINQVQYACAHDEIPMRRSGRPSNLTQDQIDTLIDFISASKTNRRLPFAQIPHALGWDDIGSYCIRHTLRKLGYSRRIARSKPPISEKNQRLRLQWALEHQDWTPSQWDRELWSDETWVKPGRHTRIWVTRKAGEEMDPTCIVERFQRKIGWMFWGCFSSQAGKGPCLFWEKEWGSIKAENYAARVIPLIDGWIQLQPGHNFMHDNASAHTAALVVKELADRGIKVAAWPPFSPDLNPIEAVWNWMKDWLQENYPQETMSYDMLRRIVKEAWEAVPDLYLRELIISMPERCQAVIAANGMHTKY